MPTQDQIDQMTYAAMKAREAVAAQPVAPTVGGYTTANPADAQRDIGGQLGPEGRDIERITGKSAADVALPSVGGAVAGMATPYNLVTTAGQVIGGRYGGIPGAVTGGRIAQVPATLAQRGWDRFMGRQPQSSLPVDVATNFAFNEGATLLGKGIGSVASAIGQSKVVQGVRQQVAGKLLGKVTPSAREAYDVSERMIDDLTLAVNRVRQGAARPLYSRDDVEGRIAEVLPGLQKRGAFTISEATTGSLPDTAESIAEGSIRGGSVLASKRAAGDVAFEEWPKVYAALLGDEAIGPDHLARMASEEIKRNTKKVVRNAGTILGEVEKRVGGRVVPLDEGILRGIDDEITLYAKRMSGDKKITLDPERIDQPLDAAIKLVTKVTGKKFDYKTGQFVDEEGALGGMFPNASATVRANIEALGAEAQPPTTEFTFREVRKLRGYLGQMAAKIPEAERRSAASTLDSLSTALKDRMGRVLDAEDAIAGATRGQPGSLRTTWEMGNSAYEQAANIRRGFQARGWVEKLETLEPNAAKAVLSEIWGPNEDVGRIAALRDLLGGEGSPYWRTMRRFKMEEMLGRTGNDPRALLEELTSSQAHSREYWETTLGRDNYKGLLDYAKASNFRRFGNVGKRSRMVGSRVEAGVIMSGIQIPASVLSGGVSPGAVAGKGLSIASWVIPTRKVALWLSNPKDSSMFLSLLRGGPIKLKERVWFRSQIARSIADASVSGEPDIKPLPFAATRQNFAESTSRTAAGR